MTFRSTALRRSADPASDGDGSVAGRSDTAPNADVRPVPLTVLINPIITPLSEEFEDDWEGCLSIPDMRGKVPRHKSIRVQALDPNGAALDFVATGFHARVVQHEYDHLNGKVYLDRMPDLSTLSFITEFARYWLGK